MINIISYTEQKNNCMYYGFHQTQFGLCLIGQFEQAICHLSFVDHDKTDEALAVLKKEWPLATLIVDQEKTAISSSHIFNHTTNKKITALIQGTPFQLSVWNALLSIPYGQTKSYREVAQSINRPTATRAVAHAIACNKISYVIPCHRVITSAGKTHKYRWGAERKQALLDFEKQKN